MSDADRIRAELDRLRSLKTEVSNFGWGPYTHRFADPEYQALPTREARMEWERDWAAQEQARLLRDFVGTCNRLGCDLANVLPGCRGGLDENTFAEVAALFTIAAGDDQDALAERLRALTRTPPAGETLDPRRALGPVVLGIKEGGFLLAGKAEQRGREMLARPPQQKKTPADLSRIGFDDDTWTVILDGERFPVDDLKAYWLYKAIAEATEPITKAGLQTKLKGKVSGLSGAHTIPRLLKKLPPKLWATIQTSTSGYSRRLPCAGEVVER